MYDTNLQTLAEKNCLKFFNIFGDIIDDANIQNEVNHEQMTVIANTCLKIFLVLR